MFLNSPFPFGRWFFALTVEGLSIDKDLPVGSVWHLRDCHHEVVEPIAGLLGERGVHLGRIVIAPSGESADPNTGEWSISLERLQNRIALAFENGRLGASPELSEGQATLHALERLPA